MSADKTQLEYSAVVEDPEFIEEPFSVSTVWDYTPDHAMENFGCDPDIARLYLLP